ncbi:14325_t:CDS:2, partial [Racocetra fulgida]
QTPRTEERQKLLQSFLHNRLIKFTPQPINRELSKYIQRDQKKFDKIFYKISYYT